MLTTLWGVERVVLIWAYLSSWQSDKVIKYMTKFERSRTHPYAIITPSTPLTELEVFLEDKLFALGEYSCGTVVTESNHTSE